MRGMDGPYLLPRLGERIHSVAGILPNARREPETDALAILAIAREICCQESFLVHGANRHSDNDRGGAWKGYPGTQSERSKEVNES